MAKRNRSSHTPRLSKQERRAQAVRQRRNQNIVVYSVGGLLVALVVFLVYLALQGRQPIGQEVSLPTLGNSHIAQDTDSPIPYNSIPPTSGPHYGGLATWDFYTQPIRYEQVVHNLEDGGVVIYYQCPGDDCPELVAQLRELTASYISSDRHVLVMPNDPTFTAGGSRPVHQDMGARIALTAWQRIDKFDEFDADRIRKFIDHYEGIDHHSGASG